MSDQLILGGLAFTDFSIPDKIGAGGKQAMVVHKLPGGQRVIDTLGPDEAQIGWSGTFFANNAYQMIQALDAMRASGAVVSLIFAGMFRSVLVESFNYSLRRLPLWIDYTIVCTVTSNPSLGALGSVASSPGDLASSDLGAAGAIAGTTPPATVSPDPSAFTSGAPPVPFLQPGQS